MSQKLTPTNDLNKHSSSVSNIPMAFARKRRPLMFLTSTRGVFIFLCVSMILIFASTRREPSVERTRRLTVER